MPVVCTIFVYIKAIFTRYNKKFQGSGFLKNGVQQRMKSTVHLAYQLPENMKQYRSDIMDQHWTACNCVIPDAMTETDRHHRVRHSTNLTLIIAVVHRHLTQCYLHWLKLIIQNYKKSQPKSHFRYQLCVLPVTLVYFIIHVHQKFERVLYTSPQAPKTFWYCRCRRFYNTRTWMNIRIIIVSIKMWQQTADFVTQCWDSWCKIGFELNLAHSDSEIAECYYNYKVLAAVVTRQWLQSYYFWQLLTSETTAENQNKPHTNTQ